MNTEIYVENPKGKNHWLSLRLGEGFIVMESVKGYKALGTPDYANFRYALSPTQLRVHFYTLYTFKRNK